MLLHGHISYLIHNIHLLVSFAADQEGDNALKSEHLQCALDELPHCLLTNHSTKLHFIAHFVLRYTRCMYSRDVLITKMKEAQMDAYKEDPSKEESNSFKCMLDFVTVTDCAYCWFQWENSHIDNDKIRYSCNTKYTSKKSGRKNGGFSVNKEGMELFENVKEFFRQLKTDDKYHIFQTLCNAKAKEYGILGEVDQDGVSVVDTETSAADNGGGRSQVVVPTFDNIDEDLLCDGLEPPVNVVPV